MDVKTLQQKKRSLSRPDQVTDAQGRRRFHGAFTGGFSAGYFNTAGSAEGWQPKNFVSSRSNRASQVAQSTTDFMDEDDGLLGADLQAKEDYDTFSSATLKRIERVAELATGNDKSAIPGPLPGELISISSSARPVGYKLLQQMGWREGQAIGRRQKRRLARLKGEGITSHGLALPVGVDASKLPVQAFDGKLQTLEDVTLAPRASDCSSSQLKKPVPKSDSFGIGYDPSLQSHTASSSADVVALRQSRNRNRYDQESIGRSGYYTSDISGKSNRSGQHVARGEGGFALFDDDDDVYDHEIDVIKNMYEEAPDRVPHKTASAFHAVDNNMFRIDNKAHSSAATEGLGAFSRQPDRDQKLLGDVGGSMPHDDMPLRRCFTDNRPPLPGFTVRSVSKKDASFAPPLVPPSFREFHVFPTRVQPPQVVEDASKVAVTEVGGGAAPSDLLVGSGAVYDMLDARGKAQYNQALRKRAGRLAEGTAEQKKQEELEQAKKEPLMKQSAFSVGLGDALRSRFAPSSGPPSQSKRQPLEPEAPKPMPRCGQRHSESWAPARLLCKRMNVPVPQQSEQRGEQGEAVQREDVLYNEHVGRFLVADSKSPAAGEERSRSNRVTVVSSVTGDFEMVPREQLRRKAESVATSRRESKSEALRGATAEEEKEEATGALHEDKKAGGPELSTASIGNEPEAESNPSLSLFQSIFCDSDSDSDSDEDDEHDEDERGDENRSSGVTVDNLMQENKVINETEVPAALNVVESTGHRKPSSEHRDVENTDKPGEEKIVFRKPSRPEKDSRRVDSRRVTTGRKRELQKIRLPSAESHSLDANDHQIDMNTAAETQSSSHYRKRFKQDESSEEPPASQATALNPSHKISGDPSASLLIKKLQMTMKGGESDDSNNDSDSSSSEDRKSKKRKKDRKHSEKHAKKKHKSKKKKKHKSHS